MALGPVFIPAIKAMQRGEVLCLLLCCNFKPQQTWTGSGKDMGRGHDCFGADRSEGGCVLGREGLCWFNCLAESFCWM